MFLQRDTVFCTHYCIIFSTKFWDTIYEIDSGQRLSEANFFSSALKGSRSLFTAPLSAVFPWTILQKHACLCHLGALFSSDAKADWKQNTKKKQLDLVKLQTSESYLISWQLGHQLLSSLLRKLTRNRPPRLVALHLSGFLSMESSPEGFCVLKHVPRSPSTSWTFTAIPFLQRIWEQRIKFPIKSIFYHYLSLSYSTSGGSKEELRSWLDLPLHKCYPFRCTQSIYRNLLEPVHSDSENQKKMLKFHCCLPFPFPPRNQSLCSQMFLSFSLGSRNLFPTSLPMLFLLQNSPDTWSVYIPHEVQLTTPDFGVPDKGPQEELWKTLSFRTTQRSC